jgi:hypothetical protein
LRMVPMKYIAPQLQKSNCQNMNNSLVRSP